MSDAIDPGSKYSPEVLQLYERLKRIQEPKGYFFNKDLDTTLEVLEGLLMTKARYSYMSCPCRLASGKLEEDRDIICPCKYREADVKEYGSCFCILYVSKEWNEGKVEHRYVPDRRPPADVSS